MGFPKTSKWKDKRKNIKKYKKLSDILDLKRIKVVDASFFIAGKGYSGKHVLGEVIGYPSLNKKTRWQSPGQMVYKLDFYPQTASDDRIPLARVGFTETLPVDVFVETCNIDWKKICCWSRFSNNKKCKAKIFGFNKIKTNRKKKL